MIHVHIQIKGYGFRVSSTILNYITHEIKLYRMQIIHRLVIVYSSEVFPVYTFHILKNI
jgi:hypothetical protein